MELQTEKFVVYFNTRDEMCRVDLRQVIYFKADRNYTEVHFRNGTSLLLGVNMASVEKLLDTPTLKGKIPVFIRIGRSFIVGVKYIVHINLIKQQLTLSDVIFPTVFQLSVPKETLKKLKNLYSYKQQTL